MFLFHQFNIFYYRISRPHPLKISLCFFKLFWKSTHVFKLSTFCLRNVFSLLTLSILLSNLSMLLIKNFFNKFFWIASIFFRIKTSPFHRAWKSVTFLNDIRVRYVCVYVRTVKISQNIPDSGHLQITDKLSKTGKN